MPVIAIGGHARRVGKTSVITGIIGALREYEWTAVKLTPHPHGTSGLITEEILRDGTSDTQRYIAAGALRAYLLCTTGQPEEAVAAALRRLLAENKNVILEGNRAVDLITPDLCIAVLRYDISEFKESAVKLLTKADAAIASGYDPSLSPWPPQIMHSLSRIAIFPGYPPYFVSAMLTEFLRTKLRSE